MIEISNLKKSFDDLNVLEGITLTVDYGEIYGLIGRSGAGKSTLLRCINGLADYDSGSLKVEGVQVKDLKGKELRSFRKNIGMIFQNFSLLERLTIYENVALPMRCSHLGNKHIDRKVKESLDLVGISEKIDQRPSTLSGGQKQRVAIARALSLEPKILLCDEATSALDPKTAESILSLLQKINKKLNLTIIVVTHQMEVIRFLCHKMSILENGKITDTGSVSDIFLKEPQSLKNLLGNNDVVTPESGVNIKIIFLNTNLKERAIISSISRSMNLNVSIVGGKFEKYRYDSMGYLIINVDNEKFDSVTKYLNKHEINWKIV